MNGNSSDSQPSPFNITGRSRAGLIRRDFLRSLGLAALGVGFGLPQSLISRFVNTSPVAAPILVDCPAQRCVLELDTDGAEKARYYKVGRHSCELRGLVVTLDDEQFEIPVSEGEEAREFFNGVGAVMVGWFDAGMTSEEVDIMYEFIAAIEQRYASTGPIWE
jgi:hypothetical protein